MVFIGFFPQIDTWDKSKERGNIPLFHLAILTKHKIERIDLSVPLFSSTSSLLLIRALYTIRTTGVFDPKIKSNCENIDND